MPGKKNLAAIVLDTTFTRALKLSKSGKELSRHSALKTLRRLIDVGVAKKM
jgi:hypothetical protein